MHACKIPTQTFFLENMGLDVTLSPNVTDLSCKFSFGLKPEPLEESELFSAPCLSLLRSLCRKRDSTTYSETPSTISIDGGTVPAATAACLT